MRGHLLKLFHHIANRPYIYLKWIVAILMVIGGLYIFGPWYLATAVPGATQGVLQQELVHSVVLKSFGAAYGGSGLMTIYGLVTGKRQWTARGLFLIFLFLTFTWVLIVAVNGLRPISWLQTLVISLFAAILYIRIKYESLGHAEDDGVDAPMNGHG